MDNAAQLWNHVVTGYLIFYIVKLIDGRAKIFI